MNNWKIVLELRTQSFFDAVSSEGGNPLYELSYGDRKFLEDPQASTKVTNCRNPAVGAGHRKA